MLRPAVGTENVLRAYGVLAVFVLVLVNSDRLGKRRQGVRAGGGDPEEVGKDEALAL